MSWHTDCPRSGIECAWTEYCMAVCGYRNADEGAALRHGTFQQKKWYDICNVFRYSEIKALWFRKKGISAPGCSLDEVWEAAELAGIAEDIRKMPMGMNTYISEGAGGISGGQRQRLMIARAVVAKPKMLIFDEATSALDNITQRKVAEALDQLKCTRIVIAHRLSTIRQCDRILVMDEGKIIEDGTYEELISQNGFFADLVKRQTI